MITKAPENIDTVTVSLKLQTAPTDTGFDILPINAGVAKGHGLTFSAAVLMDSLPLWNGLPCFLDHDYTGNQSVRHLAGALHNPSWNEKEAGIQAALLPGGPGAKDLQALRLAARSDPAIMEAVGFSAHLFLTQENGIVQRITKIRSVDCVIDPARGGKFLASLNSQGDNIMKKVKRDGKVIEVEEKDVLPTDEIVTTLITPPPGGNTEVDAAALLQVQAAQKTAEVKNKSASVIQT